MNTLPPHAQDGNPSLIPSVSGIYRITCTITSKFYIGSTTNLRKRKNEHFGKLRRNIHENPYLQKAWNRYGESAFIFEVLELVLTMSLIAREQYWLNKFKPFKRKGFNILTEAGSNLGSRDKPIWETNAILAGNIRL